MSNCIVVGSQWGDEGKAKVIDYLSNRVDIVIRFQGGANAGHTVVLDKQKIVFHMVPSGIMYPEKVCIISNGVVFDAQQFILERDGLLQRGIQLANRLFISDKAHMVLPFHKILDQAQESFNKDAMIGTTGRGIGPAYADKALRTGIRTGDLYSWDDFQEKYSNAFKRAQLIVERVYGASFPLSLKQTMEEYRSIRDIVVPHLIDTQQYLFNALRINKRLLFEGAQATFLDVDHGTYPFVTSSNTVAGAACTGSGIGPKSIDEVIGVVKAYTTRVGNGPFPTELTDSACEILRTEGGEYGATTGRPRRCGWFDCMLVRKAIEINGLTAIALTKLDVLGAFDSIHICTHYELAGKRIDSFPSRLSDLEQVVPIYETVPGWNTPISACTLFESLPVQARNYVHRIQHLCYDIPILLVSVGPQRDHTIELKKP